MFLAIDYCVIVDDIGCILYYMCICSFLHRSFKNYLLKRRVGMNYCKTVGEFDMDLLSTIEDFKLIKDLNPETLVTLIRNNRFYSETGGCYESLSEWLFNSIIKIVKPSLRLGWRQREDFKNVYSFKVDKIKDEVTKILLESGFIRKTSGPNIAIMRFLIMKTKSWFVVMN